MLYLAYDGSLNGDWIARYAIRMAAAGHERRLVLLHAHDGEVPAAVIEQKAAALARECEAAGIELESLFLPRRGKVAAELLQHLPAGSANFCVCGARLQPRGRDYLTATVSEQLLRRAGCNVVAIRVVQPGLFGRPANFLFPLAGHPRGFRTALPFFHLFLPDMEELHLLRVMSVSSAWFRYMTDPAIKKLQERGMVYIWQVLEEIRREIGDHPLHLDGQAILSDDWPKEILLQASRLRARMILLGATERRLPARFYYGTRMEQILRAAPCDVGVYRGVAE